MTILKIAQTVMNQLHYPAVNQLVGSAGETERLLLSLINEIGQEASEEYEWPVLTRMHTFELEEGVDRYQLPADISYQLGGTAWDRNNYWPIHGPLSPKDWQFIQSGLAISRPYSRFTIFGAEDDTFVIDPVPGASEVGQVYAFSYQSKNWIRPERWKPQTQYQLGDKVFSNGKWFECTTAGTSGNTSPAGQVFTPPGGGGNPND
jgi:hypothetical protein